MSDFNYQEYLRNNPLLQKEVKEEKLITESEDKDVKEVMNIDRKGNKKPDVEMSKKAKAKADAKNMKEEEDVTENEEVTEEKENEYAEKMSDKMRMKEETSSKMKVSELKAKIKEDIYELLSEEEEVEVEDEVDVDVDVEEPKLDAGDAQDGLTQDEKEIQDSLKIAYDNAIAMGDQKLADQIGNSITFFTRTHVVER